MYQFSNTTRHDDAWEWERGSAITNDVLKFRKIIEFKNYELS